MLNVKISKIVILLEIIGLSMCIYEYAMSHFVSTNEIKREKAGNEAYQQELVIEIPSQKEKKTLSVEVQPQEYSKQEAKEILEEAKKEVETVCIGENASFEEITKNMNFLAYAQNDQVEVSWETSWPEVISDTGEVNTQMLTEAKQQVEITATLTLGDYEQVDVMNCLVCKPKKGSMESIMNVINKFIDEAGEVTDTDSIVLPKQVDGVAVNYIKKTEYIGIEICALGLLGQIAISLGKKEEEKRKRKQREQNLMKDYPDIVSSFAILLSAGISVKEAWKRIALQYKEKREQHQGTNVSKNQKGYKNVQAGYEEILRTYYEIKDGVSEEAAYQAFANRLSLREYRKISMLFIQNMKKGMFGLPEKLKAEEELAFEQRKQRAKKRGEEAGTKLLLPMLMELGVVLVIMIVPAILQMKM